MAFVLDRAAYARLGRAETGLRIVGFAVWLYVGAARHDSFHPLAPWGAAWLGYGIAYAASFWHRRLPLGLGRTLLAAQAACALALPLAGYQGFEGLLCSVVIAQAPTVLSLRAAAGAAVGLAAALLAAVYRLKVGHELFEIEGAYLTFCAFALLVYRLQAQERRAREGLARANAELLGTRALLVDSSRQAERLRISRELHDSLGHHLTALSLQLQLAARLPAPAAGEAVERARGISQEALGEIRRVVDQMRAPQAFDLTASLRALASRIPAPRISLDSPGELEVDPPEAAHALFRAIQEAITNSIKHAGAANVRIKLRAEGDSLLVEVRDDGVGAREVVPGNGLRGMQERLAQVGGSGTFQSAPGRGFTLHATIPLKGAREPGAAPNVSPP